MPRVARIHYVSLKSSLVNLPISIFGPLVERRVRPQSLAVHLLLQSEASRSEKSEAYVGWTGMASSSSLAHFRSNTDGMETVEIDPQYAAALGFSENDIVEIGLVHDLSPAKCVGTEPVSADDWEIIELHAATLEQTLLSQVRVARTGQEVDVWIAGRTRARLMVVSLDPAPKSSRVEALLLTTDTEVSIAPRLRKSSRKNASKSIQGGVNGKTKDDGTPISAAADSVSKDSSNALALRVLPLTLLSESPLQHATYNAKEPLAYVSLRTHTLLRGTSPTPASEPPQIALKAYLKSFPAPPDPSQSPRIESTRPEAGSLPVSISAGKNKPYAVTATESQEEGETSQIWCCTDTSGQIPDGHILFALGVRGVTDWDIVRVTASRQTKSPKDLLSEGKRNSMVNPIAITAGKEGFAPQLAGVDDILARSVAWARRTLSIHYHSHNKPVQGVPGLLITGRSGAGKTSLARAVARSLEGDCDALTYTHYVDLSPLSETPVSTVKGLIKYWFDKCIWHRPSLLILDNLDKLLGAELEHADSFRTRHLTELFLVEFSGAARTASRDAKGLLILATAESRASLHPLLHSAHVFREVVEVKVPNRDARREILSRIIQDRLATAPSLRASPDLNYAALSTQTEGYSAADLQDLVARAIHRAAVKVSQSSSSTMDNATSPTPLLTPADFDAAQVDFVPLSLRDVKLQKSDVLWSDIGGLQETKRVLRETLEWPTKYGPIFTQSPLRLRSGLLLYGYPGCGKTLLASAVAKECGLNFISVKGPELLNKYIGASEKSVRDLFERASAAKPCVLFFDEFDSIAPKRGHDSTGVTDRVVNQMLTQMDGAEGLEGVYVLAATSRPDLIDSALLRPGRLDKSLLCNMPDASEREDILSAVSHKVSLAPSVDLSVIAHETDGFSGADLQALIYNAHLEVVHASIATATSRKGKAAEGKEVAGNNNEDNVQFTVIGGAQGGSNGPVVSKAESAALRKRLAQIQLSTQSNDPANRSKNAATSNTTTSSEPKKHEITQDNLMSVLRTTRPTISPEERRRLDRIYEAFASDRGESMPVPDEAGGVGSRASLA